MTAQGEPIGVGVLDAMTAAEATETLRPVCASTRWLSQMVAARPFSARPAVDEAAQRELAALTWADLDEALSAHPRIGERPVGTGTEAAFSAAEQAGAGGVADDVAERLRAGNVQYEDTFGWVFLICATGLSAEQMLGELDRRLANDPAAERVEVRAELGRIVQLRLDKVLVPAAGEAS